MQRPGSWAAILVAGVGLSFAGPAEATDWTSLLATLREHEGEFERCFVEFAPNEATRVTLAFVVDREGYGLQAMIVEGQGGLDSPGLCLVDQFLLRPGVRFSDPRLRGQRVRVEFAYDPSGQPRLEFTVRDR